jgi:GTP-binding protein HflX
VRRAQTDDGRDYTLTDTVGFVRHLPHQLVEAFRSTLEEVADADLILHVVDGSDADPESQLAAVREVFAEMGARQVPELVVINKADAADPLQLDRLRRREPHSIVVSARTGQGFDELRELIARELPRPAVDIEALVPYGRGDLISRIHDEGQMLGQEHGADGTRVHARVHAGLAAELAPYDDK